MFASRFSMMEQMRLAVRTTEDTAVFAAVDDNTATLLIWTLNEKD